MKHLDAALHTRGESEYVDDVLPPLDMLHAAVFGSPVAHGKVRRLGLQRVLEMPGVVSVFCARDIPGDNQIGPILADETLLAEDEVHYVGQPVAVVVAKSPEIARKAATAIVLEVEELPVVVDPRRAYAQGQFTATPRTFSMGDVEATWEKCDVIVEGRCDCGGQEHLYLETQRARALYLEGGAVRIHSSTQSPYAVQKAAARILGVANHRVEVDVKRLGGGFGGKEDQATPWACMAALASWHLKKPVELVLSRLDDLKMTGKRHPYSTDFKLGVAGDGKILAYDVKHYQNAGAFADLSTAVLERTLFHSTNSYYIPNVKIFAASCRTNLPPNTAFRGFGGPQGMFAIECALERAAEKLGITREELQRRNLLREGDHFPYGQRAQRARAETAWKEAEQCYDVEGIRRRIEDYNSQHVARKKGFAVMPVCFGISFTTTFLNQASSLVHVYTDGSVSITTGGVEMGQGISTKIADLAAKAFGIDRELVRIESTNTTRIANMSPSAASATTDLNGNATLLAIDEILGRLKKVAADKLQLEAEGISIADNRVLYKGEDSGWSWQKLVLESYFARIALSAHAFYATPGIWFDKEKEKGSPFAYHVYGTAIVEVTLDCLRGVYDIDAVKVVHDLGRPVNELVDLGQIEGGLAQGLGWMTIEDLNFDDEGKLLSHALATYKAPDVYFMPDNLQVKLLTEDNPSGPYGSKAVGEPPLMYGIGVFFAIRAAMRAFRPRAEFTFRAPLTPERVLTEIHKLNRVRQEAGVVREGVKT